LFFVAQTSKGFWQSMAVENVPDIFSNLIENLYIEKIFILGNLFKMFSQLRAN
jgi:hypothetical protein